MKPDDLTATTVEDPTRLDQAGETLEDVAKFLWDMLTDERGGPSTIEVVNENPYTALAAAGHEDVSREEFLEALDRIALQLDSNHSTEIESLRQSVLHLPSPAPQVTNVTHVTRRNVVQAHEDHRVSNTVVNNNIDNTSTTVDNRVITEINARGDVDFDLDVENDTTIADDGGVAVNGDLEDSTVNTGINTGVIAGDDVAVEDSIIGDDNLQVNDTEAEAFAVGGDATSVEADNANLGSGELLDAGPRASASLLAEPEPEFEELPMAEPEPEMLAEEEPFVDTSADDALFPEDEDLNL